MAFERNFGRRGTSGAEESVTRHAAEASSGPNTDTEAITSDTPASSEKAYDALLDALAELPQLPQYDAYKRYGDLLLGSSSFTVRVLPPDNALSKEIGTLAFDHQRGEVLVNVEFFEGLNEQERLYVFGHEIMHISQLLESADIYLGTWDKAEERSKKHDTELRPHVQKAWERFYNIVLDIHDNMRVEERSPRIYKKEGKVHPRESLYNKLFPVTDARKQLISKEPKMEQDVPFSEQLNIALIRACMLPNEPAVTVSPEVEALIHAPFRRAGRSYESILAYAQSVLAQPRQDFTTFMYRVEKVLVPLAEQLIQSDVDNGKIKKLRSAGFDINGGDIDKSEVEDIVKGIKKYTRTPGERAADKAKKERAGELNANGFSEQQIASIDRIIQNSNEAYRRLLQLWKRFEHQRFSNSTSDETGYRTGHSVNVPQAVREAPNLIFNPSEAKIFDRRSIETQRELQPRRIDLRFVIDLSGSMGKEDRQRTQEAVYSIAQSLLVHVRSYNDAQLDGGAGSEPLHVNIAIDGFGSSDLELFNRRGAKEFEPLADSDRKQTNIDLYKALCAVESEDLGGTADGGILNRHVNSIKDVIAAGTSPDSTIIVIELTDGDTTTEDKSKTAVEQLNALPNVYAKAVQIGDGMRPDIPNKENEIEGDVTNGKNQPPVPRDTFKKVWGEHGKKIYSIADLPDAIEGMLYEAITASETKISEL